MEAKLNKKLGYTAVMCSKPNMASNCYNLKSMTEVIGLCDPNSAPTRRFAHAFTPEHVQLKDHR
jgi:hypothetical protein